MEKRRLRWEFDNHKCVFCHAELTEKDCRMHHLSYDQLGNEEIADIVTLCDRCHSLFHHNWKPVEYFKEEDENHWEMWDLDQTAQICAWALNKDYWFDGDLNCCSTSVCQELIDDFMVENELLATTINPQDIQLYIRNKRYDIILEEEKHGLILDRSTNDSVNRFLDSKFGKKGAKGGNKNRSDARTFITKHDSESFNRNRKLLDYINILMEEAKKYE